MKYMQAISQDFGIYVHVPFCVRRCAYCKFYKSNPSLESIDYYLSHIKSELDYQISKVESLGIELSRPATMFWGGGTPTILSEKSIERLANILSVVLPTKEWTVEVAPQTINPSKLKLLKDIGVNRISLGVQSFNPKTLKSLGRDYPVLSTKKTIDMIAEANFEKFGIDLIFGAKGQTNEDWLEDLQEAVRQPVNHISAYCLEFESGTSCCGGVRLEDSEYQKADREAELFEMGMDFLSQNGFPQYEISNYAKEGAECLHNLSTWNMGEWLGLGASAASQFMGFRRRNPSSLEQWGKLVDSHSEDYEDIVSLDDNEMFLSALIFGLRKIKGIDFESLKLRFPKADWKSKYETLKELKAQGLLLIENSNMRLTRAGIMLADAVAVELL